MAVAIAVEPDVPRAHEPRRGQGSRGNWATLSRPGIVATSDRPARLYTHAPFPSLNGAAVDSQVA